MCLKGILEYSDALTDLITFYSFFQLMSHQERVTESQERQVNLRKDLAEMQEWMTQVDEEFLMRDFEYKSPEELQASLEEMKVRAEKNIVILCALCLCESMPLTCFHLSQRAKEDVLQKEVKVKILKDSINMLVCRTLPPGGGRRQELTSDLEGVLANYRKLCDRFKSKCHTLEVKFFCLSVNENIGYLTNCEAGLG